jgi:hypothetical protein
LYTFPEVTPPFEVFRSDPYLLRKNLLAERIRDDLLDGLDYDFSPPSSDNLPSIFAI